MMDVAPSRLLEHKRVSFSCILSVHQLALHFHDIPDQAHLIIDFYLENPVWSQATLERIISVSHNLKTTAGQTDSPQNCAWAAT